MEGCFVAGADPELMLRSPAGTLTSAIPLIAGTKLEPLPVKKGAIQRDNVMAEFNVAPANSSEEFVENMRTVLGELAQVVAPNHLLVNAYAQYSEEELDHPEARKFGCEPDFCAWPNREGRLFRNVVPGHLAFEPFRSCGGHIHVGHKPATREMLENPHGKLEVVKMMDVFLGIPSVLLDRAPASKLRRGLYGKAGAHRPKPYGVEYRTLGNFWVSSPDLVDLMYELTDVAVNLTLDGESENVFGLIPQRKIQDIVNNSRPRLAKRAVEEVLCRYLSDITMKRLLLRSPMTAIEKLGLNQTWGIA
jgi:hypothetical protein